MTSIRFRYPSIQFPFRDRSVSKLVCHAVAIATCCEDLSSASFVYRGMELCRDAQVRRGNKRGAFGITESLGRIRADAFRNELFESHDLSSCLHMFNSFG